MPRISVIVPVYKAEQSLNKCVDSILAQNFTDFELILVDDGSPDSCPLICDQYSNRDTRVKVIHKVNNGVSAARNTGIHHARGDYLVFVDSDDYIDAAYLEMLYKGYELGADIAICGYYTVQSHQPNIAYIDQSLASEYIGNIKVIFKNIIDNDMLYSPCNKMYRTKLLRDNHILFDQSMALGEDLCFNIAYLYYCEKCYLCNLALYYYVKSNSTLSNNISLHYFNIQKHLYETIAEFLQHKQIDYDMSLKIDNLLGDTLGNLSLSNHKHSGQLISAKVQEILQDKLIVKYLEGMSMDKMPKIMYLLLKTKSIGLIMSYFRMKNKVGQILRRENNR